MKAVLSVRTALLVSILTAVSTTAYFSGRIYLMLAEQKAHAVTMEQRQKDFFTNQGKPPTLQPWKERGL